MPLLFPSLFFTSLSYFFVLLRRRSRGGLRRIYSRIHRATEGRGCVPDEANREGSGSHTIAIMCEPCG